MYRNNLRYIVHLKSWTLFNFLGIPAVPGHIGNNKIDQPLKVYMREHWKLSIITCQLFIAV